MDATIIAGGCTDPMPGFGAAGSAQGMVSMNLDARPKSLEFRYDGWHVSWGSVDPSEEGFGWGPETPVYLSQDQ